MPTKKFSIRDRIKSFYYAGSGIRRFLRQEHNAWIHLAAIILVAVAAWIVRVTSQEVAILAGAVGLVWVAEMLNTCIERLADLVSREEHPGIKYIKDLAAGAVLVAAIISVIIGLFIFVPHILKINHII